MPLPFYPHAFRVVNQQVDTEAGRVLGAAYLVQRAWRIRGRDAAGSPRHPAECLAAKTTGECARRCGRKWYTPTLPTAALAAGIGQILDSVAKLLVAQKLRSDAPFGSCQWKIGAIANERVVEVESEAHSG